MTLKEIERFAKGPYTLEYPGEMRLTFYVTKADMPLLLHQVDFPNHLGRLEGGAYFISEAIPEVYRSFMLLHEQDEYVHLLTESETHRCLKASEMELERIPSTIRQEYIAFRAQQFADLCAIYGERTEDFVKGIQASAHFWSQILPLQKL